MSDLPLVLRDLQKRDPLPAEEKFPAYKVELARIWHGERDERRLLPTIQMGRDGTAYTLVEAMARLDDSGEPPPVPAVRAEIPKARASAAREIEAARGMRPTFLPVAFTPKLSQKLPVRRLRRGEDRPSNVFGTDTRYVFDDTAFPWCTVGRVVTPGGVGSGCMVGRDLMLTASHVMQWNADGSVGSIQFQPAYYNGVRAAFGQAWGTRVFFWNKAEGGLTDFETAFDYVVVKLDRNMGDTTGYTGYRTYADSWNGGSYWQHIGYPGDLTGTQRPAFFGNGAIASTANHSTSGHEGKVLGHFMDITGGHSGGPMWGWWGEEPWPRVVGVQSAEAARPAENTSGDNEAGGGEALAALIGWCRDNA